MMKLCPSWKVYQGWTGRDLFDSIAISLCEVTVKNVYETCWTIQHAHRILDKPLIFRFNISNLVTCRFRQVSLPLRKDAWARQRRKSLLNYLNRWYAKEINEINRALERVFKDNYGACASCNCAIEPDWLETFPEAEYCRNCQQMIERMERT